MLTSTFFRAILNCVIFFTAATWIIIQNDVDGSALMEGYLGLQFALWTCVTGMLWNLFEAGQAIVDGYAFEPDPDDERPVVLTPYALDYEAGWSHGYSGDIDLPDCRQHPDAYTAGYREGEADRAFDLEADIPFEDIEDAEHQLLRERQEFGQDAFDRL